MPADPETPHGRRVLSKNRMEGFSDGVFGFAITLLVLDIVLRPPGTPLQQVLHAWPFTSTRRREGTRNCRARNGNSCPSSSAT